MILSIVDLNSKDFINKLGTEYICTGFMFDMQETKKSLPEQMASFDFVGVVGDEYNVETGQMTSSDQYSMSPSGQGSGGMGGGGSY